MVNFGLNSASILGIFLAVSGAGLYFLRTVRPELSRDHDIFFAAVGLLCGLILLFQGWRLDPILQFGQFLLTGSAIFFAVETIRLRGATVEQAKRSSPIVDRDRPVSRTRVYTEAELDELEPYEEEPRYDNPRLKGSEDPRTRRSSRYETEDPRRSSNRRTSSVEDYSSGEASRSRRPRRQTSSSDYDSWENPADVWEDTPRSSRSSRSPDRPTPKRPSRPVPSSYENYYPESEENSTDYVDYHPVDESEPVNPSEDWDQPPSEEPRRRPRPQRPNRDNFPEDESGNQDNTIRFDY